MRLSSLRSSRLSLHSPRRLRSSVPSSQDPDVFANSLRKTLDAHRASNRARLVRKVYPRAPSAGLFRPEIPPENRAGYQPSAPPTPTPEEPETKKTTSKRQTRRRNPETRPQSTDHRPGTYAIRSAESSRHDRLEQRPWLRYLQPSQTTGDASAYLDAEIQALGRYLAPSPREQDQVTQLSNEVASLLETVAPHAPKLVGSRRIGLALAHSDINFLLLYEDLPRSLDRARRPSASRPQIQDAHLALLRQVEYILQGSPLFSGQVELSEKGNPVLEARHRPTGLMLQFSCGERIPTITEYLQDYLVEYPALRPLYMGTRTLLEARGLFGFSRAGIGSDALAMLLVAFLKMNHGRFSGPGSLGDQFLALLHLYGTGVDLRSFGTAVDPPGFFGVESLRTTPDEAVIPAHIRGQRSLISAKYTAAAKGNLPASRRLCIQDPTHYMNDLGRSCTRTPELQKAFEAAHEQLRGACSHWDGPQEDGSLLATALWANFDGLERLREQIARPVYPNFGRQESN